MIIIIIEFLRYIITQKKLSIKIFKKCVHMHMVIYTDIKENETDTSSC